MEKVFDTETIPGGLCKRHSMQQQQQQQQQHKQQQTMQCDNGPCMESIP